MYHFMQNVSYMVICIYPNQETKSLYKAIFRKPNFTRRETGQGRGSMILPQNDFALKL